MAARTTPLQPDDPKENPMTTTAPITTTVEPLHLERTHEKIPRTPEGQGWVFAGIGAAVAAVVSTVGSGMTNAVYDQTIAGDAAAITEKLADQSTSILVFHTAAMVSCLLLVVFAAGLRRRLVRSTPEDSLLPQVAASGLGLVSVALLLGSALTTEFVFGLQDPELLVPETVVFFGHWINTVPWVWAGAGLAALAVGLAGRSHSAFPAWLTWVSLVLGGLTTLVAISPLQYMAGATGPLWLLIVAVGLLRRR